MIPKLLDTKLKLKVFISTGLVVFFLVHLPSRSVAHEWTIGKGKDAKKVEAKAVGFDGRQVMLETDEGKKIEVPVNELVSGDLSYLKDLVLIQSTQVQKQLAEKLIQQQQLNLLAKYVDVWTVSMVAPNGQPGIRNYFAANSLHAKGLARQEFPRARIVAVRRVQPANAQGGGAGNAGLIPEITRLQGQAGGNQY